MTKTKKLKLLEKGRVQWLNIANDPKIFTEGYIALKRKHFNGDRGYMCSFCYACLIAEVACSNCPISQWANKDIGSLCLDMQYGKFIDAKTKKSKIKYALQISGLFADEIKKLRG